MIVNWSEIIEYETSLDFAVLHSTLSSLLVWLLLVVILYILYNIVGKHPLLLIHTIELLRVRVAERVRVAGSKTS